MNTKKLVSLTLVVLLISLCGAVIAGLVWHQQVQPAFIAPGSGSCYSNSVAGLNTGDSSDELSYQYHNTYCAWPSAQIGFQGQRHNGLYWTTSGVGPEYIGAATTGSVWGGEGDNFSYDGPYRYKITAHNNNSQIVVFDTGDLEINFWYYD